MAMTMVMVMMAPLLPMLQLLPLSMLLVLLAASRKLIEAPMSHEVPAPAHFFPLHNPPSSHVHVQYSTTLN
eukprot:m.290539 g.290539  ORF g.290539 m.290539 type:complete len:71 (-) comp12315_c0_seq1:34-246(-)